MRDVQYVGPVTRYHVTLDGGGELQVLAQNLEEVSSEVMAVKGRRVRLQWRPEQEVGNRRNGGRECVSECGATGRAGRLLAVVGGTRRSLPRAAAATTRAPAPRCRGPRLLDRGDPGEWPREEGQVNIVQWAGYAQLTKEFKEATGCTVNTKDGGSSDEMISLMQTGEYDGVSASGDASVRLMAAGEDVAAIDPELVPNYADVQEGIKDQDYNSLDGRAVRRARTAAGRTT